VPTNLVVPTGADEVEHDAAETEFNKMVLHMILDFLVNFEPEL
jgi:hypothetical protein